MTLEYADKGSLDHGSSASALQGNKPNKPNAVDGETEADEEDAVDQEDDVEDETEIEDTAGPPSPLKLWLRSISQWEAAFKVLNRRGLRLQSDADHLNIRLIQTPRPIEPTRQATIENTLRAIYESEVLVTENRRLLAQAAKDNKPTRASILYRILVEDVVDQQWESSFEGHVHCEASLLSILGPQVPQLSELSGMS